MPSLNIVCQKLVSLESYYGHRDVCTYRQADHNGGMADYRKARSHQTWTVDGFPHVGRHHGALRYHLVSRRLSAVQAVTHERTPIITPREGRRRLRSRHINRHANSNYGTRTGGSLLQHELVMPRSVNKFVKSEEGSYRIYGSSFFHVSLENVRLPAFDACRLARGRDALITWRALFERSELVRPPHAGVRPI